MWPHGKEYAPYFERGTSVFQLMQYPLGIHYTSSARIPSIMSEGLHAPERTGFGLGRNYFVAFLPAVHDKRLRIDDRMRRARNRNIRYAMWLSHFALDKVESDNSTPALIIALLGYGLGDETKFLISTERKYPTFIQKVFTEAPVEPSRVLTHVSLEPQEYQQCKERRGSNYMPIDEFFSIEVLPIDTPTAVSARLFKKLYQQFMHEEFVNPGLEALKC